MAGYRCSGGCWRYRVWCVRPWPRRALCAQSPCPRLGCVWL